MNDQTAWLPLDSIVLDPNRMSKSCRRGLCSGEKGDIEVVVRQKMTDLLERFHLGVNLEFIYPSGLSYNHF